MTEPRQIETALRELRVAVARVVTPPPPATIRARAKRHIPRQVITGLVAAASVAAILVGAVAVVRDTASAPPPGGEPTPSVSPTLLVRPTRPLPSRPPATVNDPIAGTDWPNATITVSRHPDPAVRCPSGRVQLRGGESTGWPRVTLDLPAYGDLTGDGRPEAVLRAHCTADVEDSGDGTGQLLVVTRESGGTLRAFGWVGPRGALYPEFWVAGGVLYADAHPWHTNWGYELGAVLAYRWQGGTFAPVDSGHRPLAEVDLSTVAGWIGCPGARVQLGPESTAVRDGFVFDFTQPIQPIDVTLRPDLDGTGNGQYLMVGVTCYPSGTRPDNAPPTGQGLLVLVSNGDTYRTADLVPVDPEHIIGRWTFAGAELTIERYERSSGELVPPDVWYWNGTNFQP